MCKGYGSGKLYPSSKYYMKGERHRRQLAAHRGVISLTPSLPMPIIVSSH